MTAQLLDFPAAAIRPAAGVPVAVRAAGCAYGQRPAFAPRRREYGLDEVIEFCGLADLTRRVAIDHLRDLAAQSGMPLPKNPRRHAGRIQEGPRAIGTRSRWCALRFDAWLDRPGPAGPSSAAGPSAGESKPAPAGPATREAMSQRARQLAAGGAS